LSNLKQKIARIVRKLPTFALRLSSVLPHRSFNEGGPWWISLRRRSRADFARESGWVQVGSRFIYPPAYLGALPRR